MAGERLRVYQMIAHDPVPLAPGYSEKVMRNELASYADDIVSLLSSTSKSRSANILRQLQGKDRKFAPLRLSGISNLIKIELLNEHALKEK